MKPANYQRLIGIGRWSELVQRHNLDSQILADHQRYTGAVYIKGYAVECALKRLIMGRFIYHTPSRSPERQLASCLSGTLGHNLIYLFDLAFSDRNPVKKRLRMEVMQFDQAWTVDLRYTARKMDRHEAGPILTLGDRILTLCSQEVC